MQSNELYQYLVECIEAAKSGHIVRPIAVVGASGIGKTRIIRTAAKDTGLPVWSTEVSLHEPVDYAGLPAIRGDAAIWLEPEFSRQAREHEFGVAFFDDFGAAQPAVQAAVLRLVLEGTCGAAKLPEGWLRVLATNRASDKTLHHRMIAPLANRMTWIALEPSVPAWLEWATRAGVDPRVTAFIDLMGARALISEPRQDGPWASPRTWEFVSDYLHRAAKPRLDVIQGTIGEGLGGEFFAFAQMSEGLPSPRSILEEGRDDFPAKIDQQHVLLAALVSYYSDDPPRYAGRLVEYALGIAEMSREASVRLIRDARAVHKNSTSVDPIASVPAFATWLSMFREALVDV